MAAQAETLQAGNIRELVRPLGIELPGRLPNYSGKSEEDIHAAFGKVVDGLLGTEGEPIEGVIEAEGVKLTVGSRLNLIQHPAGDDSGAGWPDSNYTHGPSRWLELRAPLKISGVGVDVETSTGLRLVTHETYDDLVEEVPEEGARAIEVEVGTLWTPPSATPLEVSFKLNPTIAFAPDLVIPPGHGGGTSEWRLHRDETSITSYSRGANHDRAFGIGIEVLRRVEPGMLEIAALQDGES